MSPSLKYSPASTVKVRSREATDSCRSLSWERLWRIGEAAAHLASDINLNFVAPSPGLTLSSDAVFPVPKDVRERSGYQALLFILSGDLPHGSINMDVSWDEGSIARQSFETR